MPLCKALKAIHNTFMRPHNHLQVVCLQDSNHVMTRPSQTRGLSCTMCRAHTAFKCLQASCIILKGVAHADTTVIHTAVQQHRSTIFTQAV